MHVRHYYMIRWAGIGMLFIVFILWHISKFVCVCFFRTIGFNTFIIMTMPIVQTVIQKKVTIWPSPWAYRVTRNLTFTYIMEYLTLRLSHFQTTFDLCSIIKDHEFLTQIRDSCVVRNEPFLYRLKRGQILDCVKLHLTFNDVFTGLEHNVRQPLG